VDVFHRKEDASPSGFLDLQMLRQKAIVDKDKIRNHKDQNILEEGQDSKP